MWYKAGGWGLAVEIMLNYNISLQITTCQESGNLKLYPGIHVFQTVGGEKRRMLGPKGHACIKEPGWVSSCWLRNSGIHSSKK